MKVPPSPSLTLLFCCWRSLAAPATRRLNAGFAASECRGATRHAAGCRQAREKEPPQPAPAAAPAPSAPIPPPDAATPAPKRAGKAAPPVARTPAPSARAPKPAARAVPPVAARPAPAAPAPLDLTALKEQLKATKAIGVFTKLSLKNQVDDLMKQFSDYYQGKAKTTHAGTAPLLRLADDEGAVAAAGLRPEARVRVVSSREAIWALLSDPKKFATLQG